jgi:hypothetical protein
MIIAKRIRATKRTFVGPKASAKALKIPASVKKKKPASGSPTTIPTTTRMTENCAKAFGVFGFIYFFIAIFMA